MCVKDKRNEFGLEMYLDVDLTSHIFVVHQVFHRRCRLLLRSCRWILQPSSWSFVFASKQWMSDLEVEEVGHPLFVFD